MTDTLKKKTGTALFWSFIDKGGQQVIQLVFLYILVRLIVKEDFGVVAILTAFTAVANLIQDSGFGSALVRKKTVTPQEYSTVFYSNIIISFFIYILFFFCAPLISSYYDKPILTDLSRVVFLAFIFNAFAIIQNVHLIKSMNFKLNTRITLIAGLVSGLVAIAMAYYGFGIWSLAAQQVIQSFLRTVLLWAFVRWRPNAGFVFDCIKEMFPYSIKLLSTALVNQTSNIIIPLIIGKKFSFSEVASYSQGNKLNIIPQAVIGDGIRNVAYPVLSNIGEDSDRGKRAFRKMIRTASLISFPVAFMLIVIAKPIVAIYLPGDWSDVVPIMQILAIGGAFYPSYSLISSLLQYKGRSGLLFNIELFRNVLLILLIFASIKFGVLGLVATVSLVNVISFFTGMYIAGKTISYSISEVLKDATPYLCVAVFSFLPFLFLDIIGISNTYLLLFIPPVIGSCLYLLILKGLGSVIIQETIDFIKQSFK